MKLNNKEVSRDPLAMSEKRALWAMGGICLTAAFLTGAIVTYSSSLKSSNVDVAVADKMPVVEIQPSAL